VPKRAGKPSEQVLADAVDFAADWLKGLRPAGD
jgi:hypothetical protein